MLLFVINSFVITSDYGHPPRDVTLHTTSDYIHSSRDAVCIQRSPHNVFYLGFETTQSIIINCYYSIIQKASAKQRVRCKSDRYQLSARNVHTFGAVPRTAGASQRKGLERMFVVKGLGKYAN